MTIAEELIKAVNAFSKGSARSMQKKIGPSGIGGCRRSTWHALNGKAKTNPDTLRLSAAMGTAIHTYIQEAFLRQDPFGEQYILEGEYEAEGLMGHVDLYDKINYEVVDWKTTTKKNTAYFPSKQQRWQVQLYGWLLEMNGLQVNNVTLVAISRDGDERDIVFHTEPFDAAIAREALDWLRDVESSKTIPDCNKNEFFGKNYCGYYDPISFEGCGGVGKAPAGDVLIEDVEAISAAHRYLAVNIIIDEYEKEKESIKARLEDVNGVTPEGVTVRWKQIAGRQTIDEAEVERCLGFVPKKQGRETMRLTVKE